MLTPNLDAATAALATVLGTFGVVMKGFMSKVPEPIPLITQIVQLCKQARKNGMLALESVEIEYAFLGKGVGLGVDGLEPDQIRSILETDLRFMVGLRNKIERRSMPELDHHIFG